MKIILDFFFGFENTFPLRHVSERQNLGFWLLVEKRKTKDKMTQRFIN